MVVVNVTNLRHTLGLSLRSKGGIMISRYVNYPLNDDLVQVMPQAHMSKLPNLFILGFPRCGTSSLFAWLCAHPEVMGSSPKETGFFVDPGGELYNKKANITTCGLECYGRFFPSSCDREPRLVLEATSVYVFQQNALKYLPDLPALPHFIFLVRKPSDQIYSTFTYFQNNMADLDRSLAFAEFVSLAGQDRADFSNNKLLRDPLITPHYVDLVERWVARCGRERVHVFVFENMTADPQSFMKELALTFGIDPGFYDNFDFGAENQSYRVRSFQVHRFVVKARRLLPDGPFRNKIRHLYRRYNTVPKTEPASERSHVLQSELDRLYRETNTRLADRFGLDLSRW